MSHIHSTGNQNNTRLLNNDIAKLEDSEAKSFNILGEEGGGSDVSLQKSVFSQLYFNMVK